MTFSELATQVGNDNIQFQMLSECVRNVQNGKKSSRVTFETTLEKGNDLGLSVAINRPSKFVGMVVWFPRDKMPTVKEDKS